MLKPTAFFPPCIMYRGEFILYEDKTGKEQNIYRLVRQLLLLLRLPTNSLSRSKTYLYASSDTLIFPEDPVVSVRLVKFTVLPKRQYLGIL